MKDVGRVKLKVQDGGVAIMTSAACMGQGIATVLVQIVAEAAGFAKSAIRCTRRTRWLRRTAAPARHRGRR